jgi:hypothetical protein
MKLHEALAAYLGDVELLLGSLRARDSVGAVGPRRRHRML